MGVSSSSSRILTWEEVREHGYVVAHDKVYDVKAFIELNTHPPCIRFGTDCSRDYDQHSYKEKRVWKRYLIGSVQSSRW